MLTEATIKSATCPPEKTFKRFTDSEGLYLEVRKNGGKYWFWKYRVQSLEKVIEKRLSLGVYPKVSKEQAREKRNEARKLLEQGQDYDLDNRPQGKAKRINSGLEAVGKVHRGKNNGRQSKSI